MEVRQVHSSRQNLQGGQPSPLLGHLEVGKEDPMASTVNAKQAHTRRESLNISLAGRQHKVTVQ